MRKGQRKGTHERLNSIDIDIVRTAMLLHSLLQDRVTLDYAGTKALIDGIVDTLKVVPLGSNEKEA